MYKIVSGLHQMPFTYILSYITICMKNISGRVKAMIKVD